MQKYHPKTIFAEFSDHLLRLSTAFLAGIAWFVFLWGLTPASLCSGLAFGAMIWLCIRQFSKKITHKREAQMRRIIGGELALENLLLEQPRRAAFMCALWLNPKFHMEIYKAVEWSVIGILNGKKTIITLISQHPSQPIGIQQIIDCMRSARQRHTEQTILCLTAPLTKDAKFYATSLDPPPCLVEREELIEWAGLAAPATDEALRKLGGHNNTRRSAKEWLAVILDASRARRYFCYGTGMSLYALISGNRFYSVPAAICLCFYAACKAHAKLFSGSRHWKA